MQQQPTRVGDDDARSSTAPSRGTCPKKSPANVENLPMGRQQVAPKRVPEANSPATALMDYGRLFHISQDWYSTLRCPRAILDKGSGRFIFS